jgi:16S rRNA (cytosine967-C5)-methyltransferase
MRATLGREMHGAALALEAMRQGQALPAAIAGARESLPKESWAALQDMAYQTVRQLGLVISLADLLNNKEPAAEVLALQLVGLTQLIDARRAPAIVIDQLVEVCKGDATLRFSAGFLNAVMRRFLREQPALLAQAARTEQAHYKLPTWWIELLRRDHPRQWQQVIANSAQKGSMTLRVNQRKVSVADYCAQLMAHGMAHDVMTGAADVARAGHHATPAVRLHQAVDVHALPGWAEGLVSVQDLGAQLAAPLLEVETGMQVLDACAAPGGKAAHLLEAIDCHVLALELDPSRALRIDENFQRLGLTEKLASQRSARVLVGDASRPKAWWDGRAFDRILVDAPCSASGIVARHPDIPWLRRRSDIATLSGQQGKIVHALWPLLKPGGKLLLCTCSVFRDEGEAMLAKIQSELAQASLDPMTWSFEPGVAVKLGHLLPTRLPSREHDGFFYARLTKTKSNSQ